MREQNLHSRMCFTYPHSISSHTSRPGKSLNREILSISAMGVGGRDLWRRPRHLRAFLVRALELGVDHLDLAATYGNGMSETRVGQSAIGIRDYLKIATKITRPDLDSLHCRRHTPGSYISSSIEGSLRRLQTDHVDICYIHHWDPVTPLDVQLRRMEMILKSGKARLIGACNMNLHQLISWQEIADDPLRISVIQQHINLLHQEASPSLREYCNRQHIPIIGYSPFARGWLADPSQHLRERRAELLEYAQRFLPQDFLLHLEILQRQARQASVPMANLALSKLFEGRLLDAAIPSMGTMKHLIENAKCVPRLSDSISSRPILSSSHSSLQRTKY